MKIRKYWIMIVAVALLVVTMVICSVIISCPRTIKIYQHPTLPYKLVVQDRAMGVHFPLFPGQDSDKPCVIILKNTKSGAVLFSHEVAMVQLIEDVHWTDDGVWINKINGLTFGGCVIGDW